MSAHGTSLEDVIEKLKATTFNVESKDASDRNPAGAIHDNPSCSSPEITIERPEETSVNEDGDGEDDGHSHGSGSKTPTSASTYTYSHEPYDTFKHKVIGLIADIGGRDVELLDRMRGGSTNRIVPASFSIDSKTRSSKAVGVLRIRRTLGRPVSKTEEDGSTAIDDNVLTQVSVGKLLYDHQIPSPRVLAFDVTAYSILESPYVLYEFAEGTRLDELYGQMSYEEKHDVVDQLVHLLVKMDEVQFPVSGRLFRSKEQSQRTTLSLSQSFELDAEDHPGGRVSVEGLGTNPWNPTETRPMTTLFDMLSEQLRGQKAEAEERNLVPTIFSVEKLQSMLVDMKRMGFFPDVPARNVLYHMDLEPRNLLFAPIPQRGRGSNTKWILKAVVDWDDALSLSPILTRCPPIWLWDFSETDLEAESIPSNYDEDYDLLDPCRYDERNGRLPKEDQELRAYFETTFVQKLSSRTPEYNLAAYYDEAYGTGRWLRRLFRFAERGFHRNSDDDLGDKLVQDWDEFKASGKEC